MNDKNQIRQEYIKRINRVISFIELNLDKELPLELLSKKAYFSPYHFHRIFSAIIGETLNTYTNRKRIERIASILLTEPNISLSELADKYGFNSGSSFSRAFKNFYGISPTEFKTLKRNKINAIRKENSKKRIELITNQKYICSIKNIKKWIKMNAQIEVFDLEEIKLIGISQIGNFDKIGKSYEKLIEWATPKGLLTSKMKAITIYHDNPKITELSKVRVSACITSDQKTEVNGEITNLLIKKGKFAIGRFEISQELFQKAWDSMIIWVTENGYKFRDGDFFEIYQNDNNTHPEKKFIVDICIPIQVDKSINKKKIKQINLEEICSFQTHNEKSLTYYNQSSEYFKELRLFFQNSYLSDFKISNTYKGKTEYSYFSIKVNPLEKEKLKFVLIFYHLDKKNKSLFIWAKQRHQKKVLENI